MRKRHLTRQQKRTLALIERYAHDQKRPPPAPDPLIYHQFLADEWHLAQSMTRAFALLTGEASDGSDPLDTDALRQRAQRAGHLARAPEEVREAEDA